MTRLKSQLESLLFISAKPLSLPQLADLPAVLQEVISRLQTGEDLAKATIAEEIKIEERLEYIRDLLAKKLKCLFSQIIKQATSRTEIVVSFLAILEMMKQQDLVIEQAELFGEIEIYKI